MLARAGNLPRTTGYGFEVKWDGFRAVVSTVTGARVRSRRGWDMTDRARELAGLPPGLVLDGELVAFDGDGLPSFPLLCRRMLHGDDEVAITYLIFDLLWVDGEDVMGMRYADRRELLEELDLRGPCWRTPPYTTEGTHLERWVLERGLEGLIAKQLDAPYRPGRREWIKVKNPAYWRRGPERAAMDRSYARKDGG